MNRKRFIKKRMGKGESKRRASFVAFMVCGVFPYKEYWNETKDIMERD